MSEAENRDTVERLWQQFERREWEKAAQQLHDDFEAVWPHTGEVFKGRSNFIAVNENFPPIGDWHINVKRILAQGDLVVTEIVVTHNYGLSYAASFFEMKDGKIYRLTEYWVEAGSEEPPDWRAQWVERLERPPTYYGAEQQSKTNA
jgi:ketosteroid isomerase-like protein